VIINTVPFTLPGFTITETRQEAARLIIEASSTATSAICPNCQQVSRHTHGWYPRRPQDLPCIGEGVSLELTVRRFRCLNLECPKKTFAERFLDWLPSYARRTTRLTNVLRRVGFEVSAESGRRLLRWFAITTSGDTLLRIVKRTPVVPASTPRVVGLDDWGLRKGQRYGSLILDQETRQVVELLKGRTAEDVQPWFQAHPEVEIVTRDRSPEYRNALTATAPQAQQVLDRWHLLLNLRHLAEHVIASVYRRLKQLPMPFELQSRRPRFLRSLREQQRMDASRQRRLDLYHEVQRLKQLGLNPSQMLQQLPHSYYTLRLFYHAPEFPERMPGRTLRSKLEPYLDYLESRFQAGCQSVSQLHQEIQAQGYPGTPTLVSNWLQARRLLAYADPASVDTLPITATSSSLPSAHKLAWLLVLAPEKLTDHDAAMLRHIQQEEAIQHCYDPAQEFRGLLQTRSTERLDAWLETAAHSTLPKVRTFTRALRAEYAFLRAALEHEWSSGQTEGQITRLKFIKRQMYGRASFELLRQKVLYHPGST
jgi:transposase